MKKKIFSKALIMLLLISMIISATGIIYSFIKPEEVYAKPIRLSGIKTKIGKIDTCLCPVENDSNCFCLIMG